MILFKSGNKAHKLKQQTYGGYTVRLSLQLVAATVAATCRAHTYNMERLSTDMIRGHKVHVVSVLGTDSSRHRLPGYRHSVGIVWFNVPLDTF